MVVTGVVVQELPRGKPNRLRVGLLVTICADGQHDCPLVFAHTVKKPQDMSTTDYAVLQDGIRAGTGHLYCQTQKGWISRNVIAYDITRIA